MVPQDTCASRSRRIRSKKSWRGLSSLMPPMEQISHQQLALVIQNATTEVFATMLRVDLEAGDSYRDQVAAASSNRVISFIGLAGRWVGAGSIACSPNFACQIASLLMRAEYTDVDDDVLDALGEGTNT